MDEEREMRRAVLMIVLVAAFPGWSSGAAGSSSRLTPAEASGYRATPSYEATLEFIRQVAAVTPEVRLEFYGRSAQGRPLPVVVVDVERRFGPPVAGRTSRPVVLIQNGIHAGEIDGKDACLELLRDWAEGRRRDLLGAATLLILPIYNVDGHERVSQFNRANQIGPEEGLGFRTTAAGLDLNRDFLKAVAPETRALLALVNRWHPDLHVDVHVTDGSDHDWVLTWSWAESPQAPATVEQWLAAHMPRVLQATESAGHRCGPYVELIDGNDPTKGFSSWVGGARYATGYFPLRNRPSVLLEMHAYKPYAQRVSAVRDFLAALLAELKVAGPALRTAVAAAAADTIRLGGAEAAPSKVPLAFRESDSAATIAFPVYAWSVEDSLVSGRPLLHFRRGEVREIRVPWHHRVEVERAVDRPRGYLIEAGWPVIEERLAAHGLRVERLLAPTDIEVESLWVSDPSPAAATYQGLTRLEAKVVARREHRTVPAGTLWVPADQPEFGVAADLLEPECPDSLLAWGLLSTVFERKEYIDPRTLENLAKQLLKDPSVTAAWREALADPEFAADARRRYLWWYQRTPYYAVQEVGRLPILRALERPEIQTDPLDPAVTPR